jgi:hypothetical protein
MDNDKKDMSLHDLIVKTGIPITPTGSFEHECLTSTAPRASKVTNYIFRGVVTLDSLSYIKPHRSCDTANIYIVDTTNYYHNLYHHNDKTTLSSFLIITIVGDNTLDNYEPTYVYNSSGQGFDEINVFRFISRDPVDNMSDFENKDNFCNGDLATTLYDYREPGITPIKQLLIDTVTKIIQKISIYDIIDQSEGKLFKHNHLYLYGLDHIMQKNSSGESPWEHTSQIRDSNFVLKMLFPNEGW